MASMVVYTARQEVLNLARSRHIWPKELQLISRQTDKQVKQLANIYKQGTRVHRIEPFEDNGTLPCNQEGTKKSERYLDLTKPPQNYDAGLMSPKATTLLHNEHQVSCERNPNHPTDVPVAQIVIPTVKKMQISSSKVEVKAPVSEYKSKLTSV